MKLEIGGNMYELEYTVNSVCDLEEITGKGLYEILSVSGLSSIRALLWSGLIENLPGLTIKKAGALTQEYLKQGKLEDLVTKIGEAVEQAGFLNAQTPPERATRATKTVK